MQLQLCCCLESPRICRNPLRPPRRPRSSLQAVATTLPIGIGASRLGDLAACVPMANSRLQLLLIDLSAGLKKQQPRLPSSRQPHLRTPMGLLFLMPPSVSIPDPQHPPASAEQDRRAGLLHDPRRAEGKAQAPDCDRQTCRAAHAGCGVR